ncbi:putative histone H2A.3 [Cucumispora dikerogammari]|nr:putative histone H2A.3 [Cucumispora dikerogammari]
MAKAKSTTSGTTGKSVSKTSKSSKTQTISLSTAFKKAHMKRFLKFYSHCRVSSSAATTLSLFLSIIMQEIIQSSVKQALKDTRKTIKPRHINMAIKGDSDLKALFKDCVLKAGGYEKTWDNKAATE